MKLQSKTIKQFAHKQGFALCGIAKAEPLTIEKERFEKALTQDFHAKKAYFERDIDKRFSPELLLANCKSVVVCGFNYNTQNSKPETRNPKSKIQNPNPEIRISQYAQIKDYHVFMKEKLEALARELQEIYGVFNYKTTVDSSAISEKAWAVQSGIGYYGKNGIIQTQFGSFIFLGSLLIDKEIDTYDTPNQKSCGDCGKCIAVCPTKAIVSPYYIDCNRCIANINLNKNEPDFTRIAKYGWLIACDECQNVCPNNANAPVNEEAIALKAPFVENQSEILENLTPESFEKYFKDTVIYKFKYEGFKKRLKEICGVR
jgi:epoxyqueuosine reductase